MREQMYITYAHRVAAKVREVNQILNGEACPQDEGMLGDIYYGIAELVEACLAPIVGMLTDSDELNNMVTKIMFAEEEQIGSIIEKYCGCNEG